MRYRLQRHDGTDCSATMVPITVLRMVPIQRYRHKYNVLLFLLMGYLYVSHDEILYFGNIDSTSSLDRRICFGN